MAMYLRGKCRANMMKKKNLYKERTIILTTRNYLFRINGTYKKDQEINGRKVWHRSEK